MWNGTVHAAVCIAVFGHNARLFFCEEKAQWFTDMSGFTIQVLKLPQQQSAINYILDHNY
jgi:hypothetical protein